MGTSGAWGRCAGLRNSARVAGVRGARGPAVRAVRAADNSPWWTKRSALLARAAGPGSPELLWLAGEGAASCNSRTQSPARNCAARRSNSSGGRVAPGVPWCSSIRGASRNNFQPRHCSAPEEGWVMPARASRSACWKVGWSRRGTDWKRKARWRKTGRRSMPSSAVQPEGSAGGGIGGGGGGGGVESGRALGRLAGGRGEEERTRPPRGPGRGHGRRCWERGLARGRARDRHRREAGGGTCWKLGPEIPRGTIRHTVGGTLPGQAR